jgi:hypothetical protein
MVITFRTPVTVPKRFSIGAFLGITTVWSLMVTGLQQLSAPTMLYYFFGIQLFLVCLAQMRFEKSPRWASCVAGVVVLYLVVVTRAWIPLDRGRHQSTLFTATQFVFFWGRDIYFFYWLTGVGLNEIWFGRLFDELLALVLSAVMGGAYGYALGTFTAGIFLLGNRVSHWFEAQSSLADSQSPVF